MGTGKILAIGELLWDLLPEGDRLGGAAANFAYRMAELGADVSLLSRVGNDSLGEKALEILKTTSLDLSLIQIDPNKQTGIVNVELDQGIPSYEIVEDVAYDQVEFTKDLKDRIAEFDIIYFGTLIQRTERAKRTIESILTAADNTKKFLDLNLRPKCYTKEIIKFSLEKADLVKINDQELNELVQMFNLASSDLEQKALSLRDKFNLEVLYVTLGEKGVIGVGQNQQKIIYDPGYQVQVVDTVGSGDSFCAGALFQYLNEVSIKEQCEYGNILGALNSMNDGAMRPIAYQEIKKLPIKVLSKNSIE